MTELDKATAELATALANLIRAATSSSSQSPTVELAAGAANDSATPESASEVAAYFYDRTYLRDRCVELSRGGHRDALRDILKDLGARGLPSLPDEQLPAFSARLHQFINEHGEAA